MAFEKHISGEIAYLDRPGTGTPLVLLHGIGSASWSFEPLLAHLPPALRVIAWDTPGYGGSAPLAPDWPLAADYAGALAGLLDRLGLHRVRLLGHSLGALMAGSFAADRPDRVARLCLASPALGHGVAPGAALSASAQDRIDALDRLGATEFAASRAPRLVFRPAEHPELTARVAGAMASVRMPGYGQAARMLASGRLLEDAARLSVPTDVIVGAEDVITPPEAAARAHAALPAPARGAHEIVPEAGHALYQQAPGAVAAFLAHHQDQPG